MPKSDPVHAPVPFPCVVYRRDKPSVPYRFSHFCSNHCVKKIPASLRVADLQGHDPQSNWANLRRSCFLVLVAGDVAQCVSVASALERRTSFLFQGSRYSKDVGERGCDAFSTEFHEGFVPLFFFGTMCSFDSRGRYRSTIPIESAVCLFPKRILETDLPRLIKWIESGILKTVHSSVWVTDRGQTFSEHTMRELVKSVCA